ncbi:hypothetical protein ACC848_37245 [Rhizobium johnstonii]
MNTMVQRLRAKFRDDKGVATIYFVIMTVAFLAIVVVRFVIEAGVALVAIAENTERTAAHTRRG